MCEGITAAQLTLWKLKQTSLKRFYSGSLRSFRYFYKPAKHYKQRYLKVINNNIRIINSLPITSHKQFMKKHLPVFKSNARKQLNRQRLMEDINDYVATQDCEQIVETENNAEVEIHRQVEEEQQQENSSSGSNSESEIEDEPRPKISKAAQLEEEIKLLKQNIKCLQESAIQQNSKKQTIPSNSRKGLKRPPPPSKGPGATQKNKRTMWDFLTYIQTLVTVKIDDYGSAYPKYQELEGSKIPITALKTIADLMTDWYNLTLSLPGTTCLFVSLQSAYGQRLSTKYLQPAVWEALTRFFRSFGQPGTSAPNQSQVLQYSPSTTVPIHTTTSSMIVHGRTPPADAEGSQIGKVSQKRARLETPQMFVPKIFADLQITCAKENDTLFTSRSRDTTGSTIVKLEIYQRNAVQDLPRQSWWAVADFRGTLMTSSRHLIQQALELQDLMETEMESRPNLDMTQSSVSNILSKQKWQK